MSITDKNPLCRDSVKMLGDYWTMMIIDTLSDGPARFRDFEAKLSGVNTATLTNRLKSMQQAGLLRRNEMSRADVSYELTDLGQQAVPILSAINNFANYTQKQTKSA